MAQGSNGGIPAWMRDALRDGFRHLASGRLAEASACCRRVLGARPDLVEAHFLVGLIAVELRQTGTAVSAFGSVTKLQEDHSAAWAHLARLFMVGGQAARADAALEKAAKHHDGNPLVLDLIGSVHGLLGDQLEASKWIAEAVRKEPDGVPFLVNQANNHVFLGRLSACSRAIPRPTGSCPTSARRGTAGMSGNCGIWCKGITAIRVRSRSSTTVSARNSRT